MGRTGKLFAHEWAGITPDVMAVAKGIGGGFPVGAFLATDEAAKGMVPGTHGSTYGGNPLAMAVGNAVLDAVLEPGFLDHVQDHGAAPQAGAGRASRTRIPDVIEEVRGSGLLAGIKVKPPMGEVVGACMAEKLLTVGAGENVVRLLPPLNVTEAEIAEADAAPVARRCDASPSRRPERAACKRRRAAMAPRHFLDIDRIDAGTLRRIVDMGHAMKKAGKRVPAKLKPAGIADAVLMLIFEKPSTRTRVSFDVAMRQLGGQTIALNHTDLQVGRGEPISDTAKVLSRYVDAIMIRANKHETLTEFAEHATVPVINGLTDRTHPCQIVADIMTFEEAQAGRSRGARSPGPATATTSPPPGSRRRPGSASSWRSPVRRSSTRTGRCSTGPGARAPTSSSPTTPTRPSRAPTASSPTPGCRWASRTRRRGASSCSGPMRSTRR